MTLRNYEELEEITNELKLTQDEYWEESPKRHYFRSGYNGALKDLLEKAKEISNSSMTIKFAEGIDIVIDNDKLAEYELINNNNGITLWIKGDDKTTRYDISFGEGMKKV